MAPFGQVGLLAQSGIPQRRWLGPPIHAQRLVRDDLPKLLPSRSGTFEAQGSILPES